MESNPRDVSQIQPGAPETQTAARICAAALAKKLESQFKQELRRTYDGETHEQRRKVSIQLTQTCLHARCMCFSRVSERLEAEFDRLVHAFVGGDGLDSKQWAGMARKVELMALRQIHREDTIALEQYRIEQLDPSTLLAAAKRHVNAGILHAKKTNAAYLMGKPPPRLQTNVAASGLEAATFAAPKDLQISSTSRTTSRSLSHGATISREASAINLLTPRPGDLMQRLPVSRANSATTRSGPAAQLSLSEEDARQVAAVAARSKIDVPDVVSSPSSRRQSMAGSPKNARQHSVATSVLSMFMPGPKGKRERDWEDGARVRRTKRFAAEDL